MPSLSNGMTRVEQNENTICAWAILKRKLRAIFELCPIEMAPDPTKYTARYPVELAPGVEVSIQVSQIH